MLSVMFSVSCSMQTARQWMRVLEIESVGNSFEKNAQTAYAATENGLKAVIRAENEKALFASLHFAIKNISFVNNVWSFTKRG